MLDLEARVHLDEEELVRAVGRDEELHSPRAAVVHARGCRAGRSPQAGARGGIDHRRRGFFDDLLVAALKGALPLAEVDDGAVRIGHDLHLDVPRPLDEPLEQQRVVAERRRGDTARGGERFGQFGRGANDLHALPPAARRRLDQQRKARLSGRRGDLRLGEARRAEPRNDRHPVRGDVLLRADLVAHHLERAPTRADEHDPDIGARGGELRVLGQEPVARVDRLGAGILRRGEDRSPVEVGLRGRGGADAVGRVGLPHVRSVGIRIAVDGDRADAESPQRADDAPRDLAAVGDEHGVEKRLGHLGHIRKTPKRGSGSGARETTSSARPSRSRVSAGSTMPSSHSRAVA